jgi:hypothetical protein
MLVLIVLLRAFEDAGFLYDIHMQYIGRAHVTGAMQALVLIIHAFNTVLLLLLLWLLLPHASSALTCLNRSTH